MELNREQYPVSAGYAGHGEWTTPGVAFEDYSRMYTLTRKQSGERRLPTPLWSRNDEMLRELLTFFMEERAGFRKPKPGTLAERKARAQKRIKEARPGQIKTLTKLCKAHMGATTTYERRSLRIQIEALDTYLRYTEKDGGLATVASVATLYYRVGLDSVGVGLEVSLKPPHVRVQLLRLFQTAAILAAYRPAFAESVKEYEEACVAAGISLRFAIGQEVEYRYAPATVVETINEKLVRIKNAKGEVLTVAIAQLRRK